MSHRTGASFERGAAKYKPQPLVLVVCEDSKSSKIYFEEASRHYRSHAKVEFIHPGRTDPLGVVQAALKRAKSFDHVYCVIDRDSHHEPNFQAALSTAHVNRLKITVLTSYPCFEYWLLLHFGYTRAPFMPAGKLSAADRVVEALRMKPEMGDYGKGTVEGLFIKLLPKLQVARENSARTVNEGAKEGSLNPSSPLHILVDRLEGLGKPEPI